KRRHAKGAGHVGLQPFPYQKVQRLAHAAAAQPEDAGGGGAAFAGNAQRGAQQQLEALAQHDAAASGQTPRAAADSRPRSVRQQSGRPARSSSIANTSVSHTGAKDSYKPSASARQAAAPAAPGSPARQPPNRCRQASMAASIHKRYPSPMPLWLAYIKISAW